MRNYFPAEDCLLKIKVHHCYGAETYVYKSECETLVTHSSAPSGCFQVCKDSSPHFTMKTLLVVSLIHCVALIIQGAAGEVLPFFNSRNRIFFPLSPRGVKPRFCLFVSIKIMAFFKKKTSPLPDVQMTWSSSPPVPPADAEPQEAKTAPEPGKSDRYSSKSCN